MHVFIVSIIFTGFEASSELLYLSVFHQYLNVANTKTILDLLVIQYYIRKPDILTGHVEVLDSSIVLRVPGELVVRPLLLHPHVGGQDLSPHVLQHVICDQSLSQLGWYLQLQ